MALDDREVFSKEVSENTRALGNDPAIFEKSKDLLLDLDRYKYSYLWSWFGLPIIQLPADIIATQEVIWKSKPNVIIETGVARGGSLIFLSSMVELLGGGKVIGVDIDIRKHNKESILNHPLSKNIKLVEGGSTDQSTIKKVTSYLDDKSRVMVILDSDHSFDHVLSELNRYSPLVARGCYLVVADTLAGRLKRDEFPKGRTKVWCEGDEPLSALNHFMSNSADFVFDDEINDKLVLSSSPGGYIKRL